jgi:hypothetical protein
MHPHLEIDVEGLTRTGTQVEDASWAVRDAITNESGQLTATGIAAQWAAGPPLAARADGWSTYLQDLSQRIRDCGANMVRAAVDYQSTDQHSAESLTAGIPPSHPAYGWHQGYGR